MSSITGTALNFTGNSSAAKTPQQRHEALRAAAQEVVGTTFFEPMMKSAHSLPFGDKRFHGGRGEKMFQAQLDAEFARRAGGAMKNSLADAMVKRLSRGRA